MAVIFTYTQVVWALLLISLILLQPGRSGLSSIFGGGGEFYATKRGVEKLIFSVTIITAILFAANSLLLVL